MNLVLQMKDCFDDVFRTIKNVVFRNRYIVKNNGCFLVTGDYINVNKGDIICSASIESLGAIRTFHGIYETRSIVSILLLRIIKLIKYYVSSSDHSVFSATCVIVSSSGEELKFIDYTKGQILTKYKQMSRKNIYLTNKAYFSKYFPTPELISTSDSYLIERFVVSNDFMVSDALHYLMPKYISYFESIKSTSIIDVEQDKEMCSFFYERFGEDVSLDVCLGLPKVYVHGDLWSSNILCERGIYYLTDFEASSTKFFLYDIVYLMFMEFAFYGNDRLLINYLKGMYDSILVDVSKVFNIEFNNNYRFAYLYAFFIQVVFDKWRKNRIMHDKIQLILNVCKDYPMCRA